MTKRSFSQQPRHRSSRRAFALGGASALAVDVLGVRGVKETLADEPETMSAEDKAARREELARFGFLWAATSPATHLGDEYSLVLENTGTTAQELWVFTIIMDHRSHQNLVAVQEEIMLEPGATREFLAVNDYGTANHFSTRLVTNTEDNLAVTVTLTSADGAQAATFNQRAFMIQSRADIEAHAEERRAARRGRRKARRGAEEHSEHGGDIDGAEEATPGPEATPEA